MALPLLLLLSGCCTKKYCFETSYLGITFYGFAPSEIDTIYVSGYIPGSGFTKAEVQSLTDTTMPLDESPGSPYALVRRQYVGNYQEDFSLTGPSSLPDYYEWKIFIPSVGRSYVLTNYSYKTYKCNRCFPVSPRSNKERSITTCNVNGIESSAHDIHIVK
jgi:hypothetical protein